MAKWLQVTMPDGSVMEVPAVVIAENRASYYQRRDPADERVYNEELLATLGDDDELIDWAGNNMNWSDVQFDAVLVKPAPAPDRQEGWVNGPKSVVFHD